MNYQNESLSYRDVFIFWKDHRIWWLAIFGIIGLIIYLRFDSRVFPSASLDLKLPRKEIAEIARNWAGEMNYRQDHVISSTDFAPNNDAKTFLEYELGAAKANDLMKDKLPIWSWHSRFCKQYEFEEFETWISPTGKIQGFFHKIENDKELPSLTKKEAEKLSRTFIEGRAQIPLDDYKIIKSWSTTRAHRVDHSFTWEDRAHEYNSARLRIQTTVSGNMISQFSYFLYVPEAWERKFSTIRSYNNLYETIASTFYSLIQFLAVFVFLFAIPSGNLRWRFVICAAALVAVVAALDNFNDIAAVLANYDTTKPFISYIRSFVIQTLTSILPSFLNSLTLIGAAEALYRFYFPGRIAFENFFTKNGLRSKTILNCIVIAHCLLLIDLGWVVFYYLVGEHFHFWCPLGVDSYQILDDVFPFYSAIAVGVSASVTEELMYRVLALGVVQRLTKSFWIANIFQAAAWGFMHSTYPQQPAYARGVELTLGGMLHGWVMSRYGIFPSLMSHYLFDALLDAKPLLSSHAMFTKVSALIPVVPFILLGLFIAWNIKRKGAVEDDVIANSAVSEKAQGEAKNLSKEEIIKVVPRHRALRVNQRVLLLLLAVVGLAISMQLRRYNAIGDGEHVVISREQAVAIAKDCMNRHHFPPAGWQNAVWLEEQSAGLDLQYVYEKVKLKQTLALATIAKQGYMWKIRFFKPLDPEEFEVVLDKNGKEIAFAITESEEAAGDRLSEDEAKAKAEEYLKKEHSVYAPFEFSNMTVEKLNNRTDYSFTFVVPKMKVGEADFKLYTSVVGKDVSGFSAAWEIPESWKHERDKRTFKDEALGYLRTGIYVILFIGLLHYVLFILRSGALNFKLSCLLAVPLAAISLMKDVNELPQFFVAYDTTHPTNSWIISSLTQDLQSALGTYGYYVLSFVFAWAALRVMAPNFDIKKFFAIAFRPQDSEERKERRHLWLDSLLVVAAYVALHMLINSSSAYAKALFSPEVPDDSGGLNTICSLANLLSPTFDVVQDALTGGLYELLMVAIATGIYIKYCRNFWVFFGFITVLNCVMYSSERYWQDYVIDITSAILYGLVVWFVVRKLSGFNPLIYLLIGAWELLLSRLLVLIDHGQPLFFNQLVIVAIMLASPIIYLCFIYYGRPPGREPEATPGPLIEGQSA